MWLYLVLFGILVIMVVVMVYFGNRTENYTSSRLSGSDINVIVHPEVVGGTSSTKLVYNSANSTVVRKLLGNNGKTIILVHNSPFNMEVWEPIYMYVQYLKNTGEKIPTLISYDLLGTGTAWVPIPDRYNDANMHNIAWSPEDFSKDLYQVYQKYVGTGKVTIVGYGFGGTVAQYFGLKYDNLIDHLYILATTIGPTISGIPAEKNYLVNWIAKNPLDNYLTMEQKFVDWNLCLWFENSNPLVCSNPENRLDEASAFDTVEFLLASKMYREASCKTYLQVVKLLNTFDLRPKWEETMISCPATFLVGDRDHYTNLKTTKEDIKIVAKATEAKLYVVKGKHGFPLLHPKFIYQLITGQDMSKNPLTLEVIS